MSKYDPLRKHLAALTQTEWSATFSEIEGVLETSLPASARQHRPWWANAGGTMVHQLAWLSAGWRVIDVDMTRQTVRFARTRIGGTIAAQSPGLERARGRPPSVRVGSPLQTIIERTPRRLSLGVNIPGWRLLGPGLRTKDGWRLPSADPVPAACRFHIFAQGSPVQRAYAVENLREFLDTAVRGTDRDGRACARAEALASSFQQATDVLVEVAPQDQIFLINDGGSRRANFADPAERSFVEAALTLMVTDRTLL